MAKIIKIGSMNTTLTSKTANLAKTSRQGNITNPFKFSNFEGNTLQFADVFEGFEPKKQNKLRMIASSVAGSMSKMRNGITEPIVNFVRRVGSGISHAWDYACNTNVSDIPAVRKFNDIMNTPVNINLGINMDSVRNSISDIRERISSRMPKMEYLNKDVVEVWSDITSRVSGVTSRIHSRRFNSQMSVSDLESAWKREVSMEGVV